MTYYDKEINIIEGKKWLSLIRDREYSIIKKTLMSVDVLVSTVWVGIPYGDEKDPLIFETIICTPKYDDPIYYRYATEKEAYLHHQILTNNCDIKKYKTRWEQIVEDQI